MNTNKNINEVLGSRIKNLRKIKKITREQLAEKIDVSTRFFADVEAGKVGVSLNTLKKLCLALDTTSDYLLGISEYSDAQQRYIEIDNKIKKINIEQIENLNKIIDAFNDAINKNVLS